MASLNMKSSAAGVPSPNPTSPSNAGGICSICSQEHDSEYHDDPVITYCGHVFGRACLATRLQTCADQVCPRPGCAKAQRHRCGHACEPRSLFQPYPSISPRPAERRLAAKCRACWARVAEFRHRQQDPGYREAQKLFFDGRRPRRTDAADCRELQRVLAECTRRWHATEEARRERW